jgi:cellulose biosynthesis protein BcsQ
MRGRSVPYPVGMRTLASLIQNGGSGKTTTAKYVAEKLAALGYSVLLVDGDAQGSLTANCGLPRLDPDDGYLGSAMLAFQGHDRGASVAKAQAILSRIVIPLAPGLDIIPASDHMYFFEQELAPIPGGLKFLAELLQVVAPAYHFVIIDGPPHLGPMTNSCIVAASRRYGDKGEPKVVDSPKWTTTGTSGILVPVRPLEWALRAIGIIDMQIDMIARAMDIEVDRLGLVVTDYRKGESGLTDAMFAALTGTEDVAKQHSLDVRAVIRRRTQLPSANKTGQLLSDYAPTHEANGWFADLAADLAGIPEHELPRERDKGKELINA